GAFDTAVATFVLCSVPDAGAAIGELRRVLRPGGRLLFLEHVAQPPGAGRLIQRALEPLNRVIACGCHLTRDTAALLAADFDLVEREVTELPALPWPVRRVVRGCAAPRPR
ncbi:MAG TPA: methyltransferase domain-containing protein, partial [Kofleriaceae bacterium]|nr:methyltransferase domain-containing protein [Kofleriaceae bacterium]